MLESTEEHDSDKENKMVPTQHQMVNVPLPTEKTRSPSPVLMTPSSRQLNNMKSTFQAQGLCVHLADKR